MDDMRIIHKQLLLAADSSALTEALESLIETAKTSEGRLDLASKHILVQVLDICQSSQLSAQDLLLSIKLLRNLCAGERKNQNLFIRQNGVRILSTLISSLGLCSGSENRILHMVLQLLGNVSLAGEEHRDVVWRQFYPLGFMDFARVQNKETCGTLCMILYTCLEGSNEQSRQLFTDPGLCIVVKIIQTLTVVGFREDWVKLLLSKVCFDEVYFSPIFLKLSPAVKAEKSCDAKTRANQFVAEQAFLLSILSEIINDRVGDDIISYQFSFLIFTILRNVVQNVDFSTSAKSSLPTGSSDIDILGYSLSIFRDITALRSSKVMNEEEDVVDLLVSSGLVKFLITLLRNLEPPLIIRKAAVQTKDDTSSQSSKYKCPYRGFRRDIVAIIGNCSYRKKHVQDEIREQDGILLLLQQCVIDEDNPFMREWGIWSMRNVLEGNLENQRLVADLELQKAVDTRDIAELGLRVEVDPNTRRPKLVILSPDSLISEKCYEFRDGIKKRLMYEGWWKQTSAPVNQYRIGTVAKEELLSGHKPKEGKLGY